MKLFNYLPGILKLDSKNQIKVRVKRNPLQEIWKSLTSDTSAEDLKIQLITKYKLQITPRSFEKYVYGNMFPLTFAQALIKEIRDDKYWDRIYTQMEEICFRSSRGGKTKWVKLPKEISKELIYLAGALRDGNLNLQTGRVFIVQKSCSDWLENIIVPIFKKLFNVNPEIKEGKLTVYSFPIVYFFCVVFNHPAGEQTKWTTPQILFSLPKELISTYIQGYFDAEGSSYLKRLKISISQAWFKKTEPNPSLVNIKNFLELFDIQSSIEGPYFNNGSYITCLNIFCKENPKNGILFFEKIGSNHFDKKNALQKIYEECKHRLTNSQNPA